MCACHVENVKEALKHTSFINDNFLLLLLGTPSCQASLGRDYPSLFWLHTSFIVRNYRPMDGWFEELEMIWWGWWGGGGGEKSW